MIPESATVITDVDSLVTARTRKEMAGQTERTSADSLAGPWTARWAYTAREPDELSIQRGDALLSQGKTAGEEGWLLVTRFGGPEGGDADEGLVPLNHLSRVTAGQDSTDDAEALGQQRALPDWGYDHGVAFEKLRPSHPLWLEAAVEEFNHALLYDTRDWGAADRAIRVVMDARAGPVSPAKPDGGEDAPEECAEPAREAEAAAEAAAEGGREKEGGGREASGGGEARRALRDYSTRHAAMLRSSAITALGDHRYIVVEAGNWGLGNRLYSLVGCLALALATNRTLLLRDWFLFPSRLPHLLAPPGGFPSWHAFSYEAVVARALPELRGSWADVRNASQVITLLERPAELHVVKRRRLQTESSHAALLCCDLTEDLDAISLSSVTFLHVVSNTFFAPLLLANPHHGPRLRSLLGPRPFHALSRWLLRPAPSVAAEVDAFRRAHLTPHLPNRSLIGIHIRTLDWMRIPLPIYWRCLAQAGPADLRQALVLIAADTDVTPPPHLSSAGAIFVQRRSPERTKRSYLVESHSTGLRDAIIDLFLLGSADLLVVSPMTTFGGFAHGYAAGGEAPWRATSYGDCVRAGSPEPFFHHWPDASRQLARGGQEPCRSTVKGRACGLPEGFAASEEARGVGHWLLGREGTVGERSALFDPSFT